MRKGVPPMKFLAAIIAITLVSLSGCASSNSDWAFADPGAAIVTIQHSILNGKTDILLVLHDQQGQWQFLAYSEPAIDPVVSVSLEEVLRMDKSVKELADLPRGWRASRATRKDSWERSQSD